MVGRFAAGLALLGLVTLTPAILLRGRSSTRLGHENVENIKVGEGQLLYEIVGQVINSTPTTSTQFGYFTYIKGIDGLFAGATENESTA